MEPSADTCSVVKGMSGAGSTVLVTPRASISVTVVPSKRPGDCSRTVRRPTGRAAGTEGNGRGLADGVPTLGTESSRWHAGDGAEIGDRTATGEGEAGAGCAVHAASTSEHASVSAVSRLTEPVSTTRSL